MSLFKNPVKMKRTVLPILMVLFAVGQLRSADMKINVIIGGATFTATIDDTETGRAFHALLPMTINMNELNGNEKYHYLDTSLPTASYSPGTINAGDIMLYGSSCVVLFYETFSSGYSYTRIGAVDNPDRLAQVLGGGNVTVRFEAAALPETRGDVNYDGSVDISDATTLINFLLSGSW